MQNDFGSTLRHARMRKGLDLNTVARRLRIRPDVLQSIEEGDFDRMPPRGYARNMINSYAHLLGLNATEITSRYLDEQYAYEVESARKHARGTGFDMSGADRRHAHGAYREEEPTHRPVSRSVDEQAVGERSAARRARTRAADGTSNRFGRVEYTEDYDDPHPTERVYDRNTAAHRSRRNALDNQSYINAYSGPTSHRGLRERLPLFLVIGVAAILVIVLLVLVFGPKPKASTTVANMPVNGAATSSSSTAAAAAPTSFTFSYTVASGASSWIEVYVDGVNQVAETVEGPQTKTFTCTGTLEFICSGTDGVTATQDGTALKLEPDSSTGVVDMNISFADVLAQWQAAHGTTVSTSTSTTTTASSASASTTTSTTA